jgi:DNA polymerase-3 subunit gamma/tau
VIGGCRRASIALDVHSSTGVHHQQLSVSYQVLARKWRPQRFDDVVGQQTVTRTLRNAITSGRIAQAFVFAGSRGCGKTTTARILARAINCVNGPTPDPCGECEACVEIAQGRDIDVLEIDAASHTGIDNIREVVLAGLSIAPARNRYKVFIIDEVHQLSTASFNALLKSIEEPPAHVVFMMATTELNKIPDTILSRSQVFEFRSIPTAAIAKQLKTIATAEAIAISDAALTLIARAAEGSMRDAQSAFDQVISFAGNTIADDDVSTVLGLVGRDLVFNVIEAVVDEDAPRAFALADRAVESGHELRQVCRELARAVRDLMMISVDPSRVGDADIGEGERDRLTELATRFSREDLMRAFDVLSTAEQDLRTVAQPRYYFEMALLRWMHLRKLVPLADLLAGGRPGGGNETAKPSKVSTPVTRPAPAPVSRSTSSPTSPAAARPPSSSLKDALLAEIRTTKNTLYVLAIAMAQRIDVADDAITFVFAANQNVARQQLEQQREWIESLARRLAGRTVAVRCLQLEASKPASPSPESPEVGDNGKNSRDLKAEAMSSTVVQAMLDVFPAEISDVEEL